MNYRETIDLIESYKTANESLCEADGSGRGTHYAVCTGYFSALASSMLADLPAKRQEFYRQMIEDAVKSIENQTLMRRIRDSDVQRIFDPAGVMK